MPSCWRTYHQASIASTERSFASDINRLLRHSATQPRPWPAAARWPAAPLSRTAAPIRASYPTRPPEPPGRPVTPYALGPRHQGRQDGEHFGIVEGRQPLQQIATLPRVLDAGAGRFEGGWRATGRCWTIRWCWPRRRTCESLRRLAEPSDASSAGRPRCRFELSMRAHPETEPPAPLTLLRRFPHAPLSRPTLRGERS